MTYHVVPVGDLLWKVEATGASEPPRYFTAREEAVARALSLAVREENGAVVVHRRDGTVEALYEGERRRAG